MIGRIEVEQVAAELAAIESLIVNLAPDDYAGLLGLEHKRDALQARLEELQTVERHTASVALYFGGKPVLGGLGIEADFGASIVSTFQELVSKVWAIQGGMLASRGPVRDQGGATLHITDVVHGSFGFLLEEIDERGEPMFTSPLKVATDTASALLESFGSEDEQAFAAAIEDISPRVFVSVKDFFRSMHRGDAIARVVSDAAEIIMDARSVERAYGRVESTDVVEDEIRREGELLGVIPVGRRFEFRAADGTLLRGGIGPAFGESYLARIRDEQFAGRRWRAVLRRRETRRGGNISERYTLMDLREIDE
jgi:hypothetical protein